MGTWLNDDGLYIKYGIDEGKSDTKAGVFAGTVGNEHVAEFEIDLTKLTATETILNDAIRIPHGCTIARVEVVTVVAAATGTAIDVGFIESDRSTELDYDGILAAFATATMNAVGEITLLQEVATLPASITTGGALIGQDVDASDNKAVYVSASRTDATAFTAGKIRLRIFFIPQGEVV